jgi:hypothetical protein
MLYSTRPYWLRRIRAMLAVAVLVCIENRSHAQHSPAQAISPSLPTPNSPGYAGDQPLADPLAFSPQTLQLELESLRAEIDGMKKRRALDARISSAIAAGSQPSRQSMSNALTGAAPPSPAAPVPSIPDEVDRSNVVEAYAIFPLDLTYPSTRAQQSSEGRNHPSASGLSRVLSAILIVKSRTIKVSPAARSRPLIAPNSRMVLRV